MKTERVAALFAVAKAADELQRAASMRDTQASGDMRVSIPYVKFQALREALARAAAENGMPK